MGKFTNITTQLVVPNAIPRGSSVNAQVLVGTPGIAIDLIRRRQLNLSKMKVFVWMKPIICWKHKDWVIKLLELKSFT